MKPTDVGAFIVIPNGNAEFKIQIKLYLYQLLVSPYEQTMHPKKKSPKS
jgi:hypothetical protein